MTDWPKISNQITKSELLEMVRVRDKELHDEENHLKEELPKKLSEWENTIHDRLVERIPQIIDLLRQSDHGYLPRNSYGFATNDDPVQKVFEGLFPPDKQWIPDERYFNQYQPAILYLESLENETLTFTDRAILQRLGCLSY